MFTAAQFTIAKLWKEHRYPSIDEERENMVVLTMEFYSAINKNEIMSFAEKWMELENIMLSETKVKHQMLAFTCGS